MPSIQDCCTPGCATVPPVNVPGAQGPQGPAGADGSDGAPAYSIVTSLFVIPAVGNDVLVNLDNTLWLTVGQTVIAGQHFGGPATGPANFTVITINSATTATLRALAYPGDAVNPASIAAGGQITASGQRGPTGANGTAGSTFPTTTKGDSMMDDGSTSPVPSVIRVPIGLQGQARVADPFNATPANVLPFVGVTRVLNTTIASAATGPDTTEDNLLSFVIPANALRNAGDSIEFEAVFDVLVTAVVATKTIKIKFGASTVLQFGNAALNGGSIVMRGRIVRGSVNSQICWCEYITTDGAAAATVLLTRITAAEVLSGAVTLQCTGQNGTNAVAGGITQQALLVSVRAAS